MNKFAILLQTDIRRLINGLKFEGKRAVAKGMFLFLMTAGFIIAEYLMSDLLFRHILQQKYLEELRFLLLGKLMYMVFLIFFALLAYSNIVLAIYVFFISEELDLIHSKPLSNGVLFTYRYLETFLRSSWMFIFFGIPILLAYGHVLGAGAWFVLRLAGVVLPVLIIPTGFGVTLAILLILYFSPKRTQRALLLVGMILAVGLILIFRWMKPEQIVDPLGVEQITAYLQTLRIPSIEWLPSTWAAEALSYLPGKQISGDLTPFLWLWISALSAFGIAYFTFSKFWWYARSGGRGSLKKIQRRKTLKISRKNSFFRQSLVYRDCILFVRDAGQWSQVIVIAALMAIYVFNFKNLPYQLYGFQYNMSFMSVIASGLILAALLARFAYPSVSSEGQSFWILKSSPIRWKKYLLNKFMFYFVPVVFIGIVLVSFSLVILDVPRTLFLKCIFLIVMIAFSLTGLALGLGAQHPRFDIQDPARVAVSIGGLMFMIFSLGFIVLIVFIAAIPDLVDYFSLYWGIFRYLKLLKADYSIFVSLVIAYYVGIIPVRRGIRSLEM